MISEKEHEAAVQRGLASLRSLPRALSVRFNSALRVVEVELNTGYSIHFPPERAQGLQNASDDLLSDVEVSGVGFGIYFPLLDVDLWVPSLAKGRFGSDRWEEAWLAKHPLEDRPAVRVQDDEESALGDHIEAA